MNPFKKLLNWYFSKNALPYWCILLLDFLLLVIAGILTYWIFIYRRKVTFDQLMLLRTLVVYAVPIFVGARMFQTYSGIIRYSSFVDLTRVFYANLLSLLIAYPLHYWVYSVSHEGFFYHLHFRHISLMYVIGTLLMWLMRVLVKTLFEVTTKDIRAQRALVYGSIDSCIGLAKNIRTQNPRKFVIKGFISDTSNYTHNLVMGEKVYSPSDDFDRIINKYKIEAVLVSPQGITDFRNLQDLQDKLIAAGVKIYMSQGAKEVNVKDGQLEETEIQMKEVSVEDLLPRDEIKVDMKSMGELLNGKRILVTGAAGSIGSELVRQIATYQPAAMMLIDQAETPEHDIRLMMAREFPDVQAETVVTSICKEDRMEKVFSEFRPDYVFHAAAYKHVPMMEDNPSEAVQNNIYGTKVIADLSNKYGVKKFVMVSTDKAVNPTNIMGASKRICEMLIQSYNNRSDTEFVAVRFGNVLGSNGSVIPLFKKQIEAGGPVTVTHPKIIRYFMTIPEAVSLVLQAGAYAKGGEIFVLEMGEPVRILDLAINLIRLSGYVPGEDIQIQFTGLRPGEKLYEEMLMEEEGMQDTANSRIHIGKPIEFDEDEFFRELETVNELSKDETDDRTIREWVKKMVPTYQLRNPDGTLPIDRSYDNKPHKWEPTND